MHYYHDRAPTHRYVATITHPLGSTFECSFHTEVEAILWARNYVNHYAPKGSTYNITRRPI